MILWMKPSTYVHTYKIRWSGFYNIQENAKSGPVTSYSVTYLVTSRESLEVDTLKMQAHALNATSR